MSEKKKKQLRFSGEAANLRAFLGPSDRMLQDLLHPPAAYFYWANVVAKLLAQGPIGIGGHRSWKKCAVRIEMVLLVGTGELKFNP